MRQLDSSIGQSIAEEQKIATANVANDEKTLSGISAIEQGESCPRLLVHPEGQLKELPGNELGDLSHEADMKNFGEPDMETPASTDMEPTRDRSQVPAPWSYLFIRKRDAEYFSLKAETEGGFRTFIHRTIVTDESGKSEKGKPNGSAQDREASNGTTEGRPTISGLIFIQGKTKVIRKYLWERFPQYHLVNDCSTRKAAVIPDSVMQPFMRIANTDPSRIRFLVNPLTHYAEGNTLVEIMTGPLAGLQGYIIRIDRDRKLVIGVGDMTVAIGGVHKENFEKVEEVARAVNIRQRARRQAEQRRLRERIEANVNADVASQPPDPRLLTPIQQKVDTAFFTPETFNDILVITTNIELWTERARRLIQAGNLADASEILTFLLEEIGYWFTNIYKKKSIDLTPVKKAGNNAYKTALTILDNKHLPERTRQDLETNLDSQMLRHGYLFIA
ncbi:putative transcriptional regulatory protein [Bacteroides sp. CAG:770]|nr:putative transcriptional regulatory protein [Bacteroides sp. CAG:770]